MSGRRDFLKLFGGTAAAAAVGALATPDKPPPDEAPVPVDDEASVRFRGGQFEFRYVGELKRHDIVTLADGGKTVRQGGFDDDEVLLGVVVNIIDEHRVWIAVDGG